MTEVTGNDKRTCLVSIHRPAISAAEKVTSRRISMLANFKRTTQVSVLLSALAASAVGAVGVAGIAYAAPNFERVFESHYSQLLLAHKSATPASGNYDNAVQPVKIAMQNEGAFTNVCPKFSEFNGKCHTHSAKSVRTAVPHTQCCKSLQFMLTTTHWTNSFRRRLWPWQMDTT